MGQEKSTSGRHAARVKALKWEAAGSVTGYQEGQWKLVNEVESGKDGAGVGAGQRVDYAIYGMVRRSEFIQRATGSQWKVSGRGVTWSDWLEV